MLAQEHTIETLNSMPLWELYSFCKAWRITLEINDGAIVAFDVLQ